MFSFFWSSIEKVNFCVVKHIKELIELKSYYQAAINQF